MRHIWGHCFSFFAFNTSTVCFRILLVRGCSGVYDNLSCYAERLLAWCLFEWGRRNALLLFQAFLFFYWGVCLLPEGMLHFEIKLLFVYLRKRITTTTINGWCFNNSFGNFWKLIILGLFGSYEWSWRRLARVVGWALSSLNHDFLNPGQKPYNMPNDNWFWWPVCIDVEIEIF